MRYLKTLGSVAISAAALMALTCAGTASATELDCNLSPTQMCPANTPIHAVSEGAIIWHPPIGSISCNNVTIEGTTTNTGGASETVKGHMNVITYTECNSTVNVLKPGSFEIHTDTFGTHDGNGTITSSGTEMTVVFLGFHCIFSTNNTAFATITDSNNQGETAVMHLEANVPRTGGSSGAFCGTAAQFTGTLKITTPDTFVVT